MKLYSGPLSLYARKVEIALGEKRLAFDREMVAFSQDRGYTPKHPAVLAANPKAQVPVLEDGGLVLFDSTVILEYLEDAYPAPPLYPATPAARARCRMIELFADEVMLPPLSRLMYRTEPESPDPARRAEQTAAARDAEADLLARYAWLGAELADRPCFCGALSVADIAAFMAVTFAIRLGAPGPQGALSAPGPQGALSAPGPQGALAAWHARLAARPAFAAVAAEIAEADRRLSRAVPPFNPAVSYSTLRPCPGDAI